MLDSLQQWLKTQAAPIAVTDCDGRILDSTAALLELFPMAATHDPHNPADLTALIRSLCRDVSSLDSLRRLRGWLQGHVLDSIQSVLVPHSEDRVSRLTLLPQYDSDQRPNYWIWIFEDASQSLRLEQHQTHSEKMRSISRLAGGMAHEFNNLLTAVMGHLELMRMKIPTHEIELQQHIDKAEQAGMSASRLILELRRFAGRDRQSLERQSVVPVVQKVCARLTEIGAGRIHVTQTFPQDACLFGRFNAVQLEDALLKLGVNAVEAIGPHPGRISFRVRVVQQDDAALLQILIRDTGPGVPADARDRVFEPFFTTKDPATSSGLGMAVAYGLIEEMGGAIRITDSSANGTEMTVSFPSSAET